MRDGSRNQVAISALAGCESAAQGRLLGQITGSAAVSPGLDNAAWRAASVEYDRGAMTVRLDGRTVIGNFALPGGPIGTPFWLGFGAGTGDGSGRQEVRNVAITFRTARCL